MGSPNLDISHVAANQNQKEVTVNTAIDELDGAISGLLSVALSDADYTLNSSEGGEALAHVAFVFTGALTADRNIIVPANKKVYFVSNQTTGGFNITVATASGTGVKVAATPNFNLLYCDGTNVVAASADVSLKPPVHIGEHDYSNWSGSAELLVGGDVTDPAPTNGWVGWEGIGMYPNLTYSTNPVGQNIGIYGLDIGPNVYGGADIGWLSSGYICPNYYGNGNVNQLHGLELSNWANNQDQNKTCNVSEATGLVVYGGFFGGNVTADWAAGIDVGAINGATENYGIYVEDMSGMDEKSYALRVVGGKAKLEGIATGQKTITADYTATFDDHSVFADSTTASVAVTLPDATLVPGAEFILKKKDDSANTVTITPAGTQTIDGANTFSLAAQYKYIHIQSDGSDWMIIGGN